MELTHAWDCPFCGTRGNEFESCMKCGTELISCYTDEEGIKDGELIDLKTLSLGGSLPMTPNGLAVNRCTKAVFLAFVPDPQDGILESRRLWQAVKASMEREDDGWFKGTFEGQKLWLIPNETGGMTLMFPEDY